MPDPNTPPNGGEGDPASGGSGGEGAPEPKTTTPEAKTFTQAEVDEILKVRLARAKPTDYDELKTKAAELDQLKADGASELEKATTRAEKAEKARDEAIASASAILKRTMVMVEAAAQNAADPEVVAVLLEGSDAITVEDGKVIGAKQAVEKLLKDKKFLQKATAAPRSGAEFGGNDQKTLDERIAAAEAAGKWPEARQLKIEKLQQAR